MLSSLSFLAMFLVIGFSSSYASCFPIFLHALVMFDLRMDAEDFTFLGAGFCFIPLNSVGFCSGTVKLLRIRILVRFSFSLCGDRSRDLA